MRQKLNENLLFQYLQRKGSNEVKTTAIEKVHIAGVE
jgi:hypothetical protein